MNLTDIRRELAAHGIQLTKSLGQNFMHDANQIRRIVAAAEVGAADSVLEIGPGLGPLTEVLLREAGHVLAIEADGRLAERLRERFAGDSRFELLHADALAILRQDGRDWSAWKLVANLPYSVASPLLVEFALMADGPQLMAVTLQQEVAERLAASSGGKDYGVLTLLVQQAYEVGIPFNIPPGCFFPPPRVHSACAVLRRRKQPLLTPDLVRPFTRLVKLAFSQRRKMMLKLLKQDWPLARLATAFTTVGLDEKIRAEKVTLEQFAALAGILNP